jgi:gamma-glutamyltranspeptidase
MTPTIVLNDKHEAILALGAPGGSRIISGVYYVLSRVLREGESIDQALAGCRFHHQWSPDKVTLEEPCFNENVNELKKIYPAVEQAKPFFFGEVQAVQRVKVEKDIDESAVSEGYAGDVLISGVDPRGEGKPMVIERPLVEQ